MGGLAPSLFFWADCKAEIALVVGATRAKIALVSSALLDRVFAAASPPQMLDHAVMRVASATFSIAVSSHIATTTHISLMPRRRSSIGSCGTILVHSASHST